MSAPSSDRPGREQFAFAYSLRVRWSEVDPQGIVFNPNYFVYFDVAVTEYWRALGFPYPDGFTALGVDTFARAIEAEYLGSARFDDVIDVAIRTRRIGRSSLACAFAILRGDEILTRGEMVYVVADAATRRPVSVPEPLRAAILALERVAPETA
ncbi:MAG: acyl-CoA thioesterase [Alphaproteobacteria bacterium]|nr:acyl-CoA thioesterase [Alphaproteobacteria bacterium]